MSDLEKRLEFIRRNSIYGLNFGKDYENRVIGVDLNHEEKDENKDRDTTTVTQSESNEEWYCHSQICDKCGDEFMSPGAKFCLGCGRKIVEKEAENERN